MVSHLRRRLKVTREKITISTRADLAPGSRFTNHGLRFVAPADAEALGSPNEFRERFDAPIPHDVGAVAFVVMRCHLSPPPFPSSQASIDRAHSE